MCIRDRTKGIEMTAKSYTCWIITEGMAGTENQCIGIAEHLGYPYSIKKIQLNNPWKTLSPYIGFEQDYSFSPKLSPPWPDILIASGRKSIAASRYIKKMSKGHTFTVQVQDPRVSENHFDLLAIPEHDPLRGSNVIVTKASPNKITQDTLTKEKEAFPEFENLRSPRIAVLIGGSSKAYNMTHEITENLANKLQDLDGSLMITCSRRTGIINQKILETKLKKDTNYFWTGSGNNPYLAFLAWADYILVTADSASMISESCTTGKPVYMIELDGGKKRISSLHNNLIKHGALRIFDGSLEKYEYTPLNDAKHVADAIKKEFKIFTRSS